MTDSNWITALKALTMIVRGWLPQQFLRLRWPAKRILDRLDVFPCGGTRFYTGNSRPNAAIEMLAFNIHNLTPVALKLVGADLEVLVNCQTLFRYEHRFPTENAVGAFARGGFHIRHDLTDAQARTVRAVPDQWVLVRIRGRLYFRSVVGEFAREVSADVVALIDPEERGQMGPRLAASR